VFWSGTNCQTLVHELDHDQPKTTNELLDITTRHAYSEEVVGVVFVQSSAKAAPSSSRGAPTMATNKGARRGARSDKRGSKRQTQRVAVATSYDEGNNDKDIGDSDEELVTTTECDSKAQARQPTDHFKKFLEATCPNHTYPVKHRLKECTMMKNYITTWIFAKGKRPEGDSMGKVATPFLEEKAIMSIYGMPAPHESQRKLKLTGWAINTVSAAVPEYLRWSESSITFDRTDHPDSIPKPGRFPLIVDPLVGMTWLTKALMDGGSGLNLMYLDTFERLGLTCD
jgi:hypothetical protein